MLVTQLHRWVRDRIWRVVAVVLLVMIVIAAVNRLIAWGSCEIYGAQTEREVRYAAFVGCLVKAGDGWVPKGELRIVQ